MRRSFTDSGKGIYEKSKTANYDGAMTLTIMKSYNRVMKVKKNDCFNHSVRKRIKAILLNEDRCRIIE